MKSILCAAPRLTPAAVLHPHQHRRCLPQVVCRSMFAGPGSDKLLVEETCTCNKDTPLVKETELPELLAAVPAWKHDQERHLLTRKFVAKNFMAAMRFFNQVAQVAEAQGHHPDLHLTSYREVEVNVYTHAAGGLTRYDFILAAKLDRIEVEYSPKWLQQHQQQQASAAATVQQPA